MSAELLRRAAALMRARAEAASPGPWSVNVEHGRDYTDEAWSNTDVTADDGKSAAWYCDEQEGVENAEHIASWHPAVALAVAKALDDVAQAWENCDGWTRDIDDDSIPFEDTVDGGWLSVARAYLGESA